jgi:hypothetical protein
MSEQKKPNFPSKPCPKCGTLIHARVTKHEACGWSAAGNGHAPSPKSVTSKKPGRPKGVKSSGEEVSIADITAVKQLVTKMGADKVRQLAEVLS